MKKALFVALAIVLAHFNLSAQWVTYNNTNSPIPTGANVPHVAANAAGGEVYVLTLDTAYHLFSKRNNGTWVYHSQFDSILSTINAIYDTKFAHQTLWMQTSKGLVIIKDGHLNLVSYEGDVSSGTNGIVPMSEEEVWFIGGKNGKGITRYNSNTGWFYVDDVTHPNFKQDIGLTDLKYNASTNTLWIAANCFGSDAGVYAYQITSGVLTQFKPEGKYNCVHAVEPTPTHLFVGTSNFSSIRMMNYDGTYLQTLNSPKITWVTETRIDPADSAKVWILTERGLMHFKDTANYQSYTALNAPLDGFMNELSVLPLGNNLYQLWIGATKGLFAYTYQASVETGLEEVKPALHVDVMPNPTKGLVHIVSQVKGAIRILVVDAQGRTALESEADYFDGDLTLDVSSLPSGIYVVVIRSPQGTAQRKLVRIN